MSEIKDKIIGIYSVVTGRDLNSNEVKIKRYIHDKNRLHAYVRDLSQREKFAAKAVGAEQSILFKINHNRRVEAGQHLEYKGENYVISDIDGFEHYGRDLTLRATRIKAEVFDYAEYIEQ